MKNIRFILIMIILAVACVMFASCITCRVDKPKNLQPINWANYNNVYTVFWNCKAECGEYSFSGNEIKIKGWLPSETYEIIDNYNLEIWETKENADKRDGANVNIPIIATSEIMSSVISLLNSENLNKQCFIKGKLEYMRIETMCCRVSPRIVLENIDNISFENEGGENEN
ncbi:MAG: hypothetical protein LBC68_14850 [Prevotellaceae bacterium]|jgi:hypothetical protein|nr:hypothetical protein [Prevotellaceae bacterium]